MKSKNDLLLLGALSFGAMVAAPVFAQEGPGAEAAPAAVTPKKPLLKYVAPKTGATAGVRIDGDGGSRGSEGHEPAIYVLTPEGDAFTTQKQPCLFYFQTGELNKTSPHSLTFSVIEPKQAAPLIKAVADKSDAGVRRIQVSRHGVELQPGVRYEWKVALGSGTDGKSQDVFASGSIQYVEPTKELNEALAANPNNKASVYAEHGIWYDALEEISNQILKDPKNPDLLAQRASLLEQAGLRKVASAVKR